MNNYWENGYGNVARAHPDGQVISVRILGEAMRSGDLFGGLPDASREERFEDLLTRPGVRIERIVSGGHASPEGFWYDQAHDEWVALMRGSAVVEREGGAGEVRLSAGTWLHIPARLRHRVKEVSLDAVWLAVHIGEGTRG